MIPTVTGLLIIMIGLYLYFRRAEEMLAFALFMTLFPAASAIDLPALGGSSIPPAMLSLAFLGVRILRRDVWRTSAPPLGLTKNAWLVSFCLYCAVTALVLPRLFAGQINLIPMGRPGLGFVPLRVTAQNTTQAVYLLGTGFAAVAATILSTRSQATVAVIKAMVVITWIQALSGVADLLFSAAHIQGAFDFARTGSYAQLDQGVGDFHRISALCSEPSVYAANGAAYFIFMCELWLRRIAPMRTGLAALAMLVMIGLSTSSTGYIGLGAYALVIIIRALMIPGSLPLNRAAVLVTVSIAGLILGLLLVLAKPHLAASFISTIADMTINKGRSKSGLERGLWAKQGLDAMKFTHGLGVGVGSFRSSSIFTAMLGSVGPAGLMVFLGYCLYLAKLGRRSTYVANVDERTGAGAAAGWTALLCLAPASVSWASADPGLLFAVMAGLSLGWRSTVVIGSDKRPSLARQPFVSGPPQPVGR